MHLFQPIHDTQHLLNRNKQISEKVRNYAETHKNHIRNTKTATSETTGSSNEDKHNQHFHKEGTGYNEIFSSEVR